jgi:hypothetical protein
MVWNIGKEGDRFEEDGSIGAEGDPAAPRGLWATDRARVAEDVALLAGMRDRATEVGVSAFAVELGVDASNLAKVLSG